MALIQNSKFKIQNCLIIFLLAFAVSGCARNTLPYHTKAAPLPGGAVCRVAVLPFMNEGDFPLADSIYYKVFLAQFNELSDFHLAQEGDVLKIFQQLRILPGAALPPEQLELVASRLNAQLLITANVVEMRENPGEHGSINPVLAVNMQIRDGISGDVIWNTYHRRQGTDSRKAMHFGTIHTVTGLSEQVSGEIINLWFKEGLTRCDVSSRF